MPERRRNEPRRPMPTLRPRCRLRQETHRHARSHSKLSNAVRVHTGRGIKVHIQAGIAPLLTSALGRQRVWLPVTTISKVSVAVLSHRHPSRAGRPHRSPRPGRCRPRKEGWPAPRPPARTRCCPSPVKVPLHSFRCCRPGQAVLAEASKPTFSGVSPHRGGSCKSAVGGMLGGTARYSDWRYPAIAVIGDPHCDQ